MLFSLGAVYSRCVHGCGVYVPVAFSQDLHHALMQPAFAPRGFGAAQGKGTLSTLAELHACVYGSEVQKKDSSRTGRLRFRIPVRLQAVGPVRMQVQVI